MFNRIFSQPPLTQVVFLDRDGVVNERNPSGHVLAWSQFQFKAGVFAALSSLVERRLPIVVISNQSCIARSLATQETISEIMEKMRAELDAAGIPIAAWYCCPHGSADECLCRKPRTGMILAAAKDLAIDVASSFLIGDKQWDLDAGLEAGCRISLEIDEYDEQSLDRAVRVICEDVDVTGR